jgi:hypothetical protein
VKRAEGSQTKSVEPRALTSSHYRIYTSPSILCTCFELLLLAIYEHLPIGTGCSSLRFSHEHPGAKHSYEWQKSLWLGWCPACVQFWGHGRKHTREQLLTSSLDSGLDRWVFPSIQFHH